MTEAGQRADEKGLLFPTTRKEKLTTNDFFELHQDSRKDKSYSKSKISFKQSISWSVMHSEDTALTTAKKKKEQFVLTLCTGRNKNRV